MKKAKIWQITFVVSLLVLGGYFAFLANSDKGVDVSGDVTNITAGNVTQSSQIEIITLDVSQLVLDSHDVEAGYTLKREFSGSRNNENYESFVKKFDKEVITSIKEIRTIYSEAYKFRTIEDTDEAFRTGLINQLVYSQPNYKIVDFEQLGDSSLLYKADYLYDFYPFESYTALIKDRNVIFAITLSGYSDAVEENELIYYARKVIELSKEEPQENLEIPKTQIASQEEDLTVSLTVNNETSSKVSLWRDNEILNNYGGELKIDYNSKRGSYTYSFYDSNKQFLVTSVCINNSYGTISTLPQFFYLEDNKGNHYTGFTKNSDSADKLDKGKRYCLNYVFPIFKEYKHPEISYFDLVFNTDKKVVLGKTRFYLNDLGEQ